jgi:hypothetical protein
LPPALAAGLADAAPLPGGLALGDTLAAGLALAAALLAAGLAEAAAEADAAAEAAGFDAATDAGLAGADTAGADVPPPPHAANATVKTAPAAENPETFIEAQYKVSRAYEAEGLAAALPTTGAPAAGLAAADPDVAADPEATAELAPRAFGGRGKLNMAVPPMA